MIRVLRKNRKKHCGEKINRREMNTIGVIWEIIELFIQLLGMKRNLENLKVILNKVANCGLNLQEVPKLSMHKLRNNLNSHKH